MAWTAALTVRGPCHAYMASAATRRRNVKTLSSCLREPSLMGETACASTLTGSPQALSGGSQSYRGWWGSWLMGRWDTGPGLMREKMQVPMQGGGVQGVGL